MSNDEKENKYYGKGPGYDPVSAPNGGKIQTETIYEQYREKFSEKAQKALDKQAFNLVHEYDDVKGIRRFAVAKFLGARVKEENIESAVEVIASKINEMAENGFIVAALAPLIIVELAPLEEVQKLGLQLSEMEKEEGYCRHIITSYVNLTEEGVEWMKTQIPHLDVKEGGIPNTLGE